MDEFCILQVSGVVDKCISTCVKFLQYVVYQKLFKSFIFDRFSRHNRGHFLDHSVHDAFTAFLNK